MNQHAFSQSLIESALGLGTNQCACNGIIAGACGCDAPDSNTKPPLETAFLQGAAGCPEPGALWIESARDFPEMHSLQGSGSVP